MFHAHIDRSQDLDGEPVVFACFDLSEPEIAASAHAVAATVTERFRNSTMSADDVLEFRELTALGDDLAEQARRTGAHTIVMRPARLSAYRGAVLHFVDARDEVDWLPESDRQALESLHELLLPLEDLCGEAVRAALLPVAQPH